MHNNLYLLVLLAAILFELNSLNYSAQATRHLEHKLRHGHRKKLSRELDKNSTLTLLYEEKVKEHMEHQSRHTLINKAILRRHHKLAKNNGAYYKSAPRLWQHLQDIHSKELDQWPTTHDPENSMENENSGSEMSEDIEKSLETERTIHRLRCPKCEQNKNVARVTKEELTQLRIEYVKQQILEKLRITEPPKVSGVRLPIDPIDTQPAKNKELDEYYAHNSKKFIFLEKEECPQYDLASSSVCFKFNIDDKDIDGFDVNTAVLWIFKNKAVHSSSKQETIIVTELQKTYDSKDLPLSKTIAIQNTNMEDEWLKIDIEWPTKRWFGNHELSHLIQISCQSCGERDLDEIISFNQDYRPFIMINTQNRTRTSRKKRGINCTHGVKECCREKLYISFKDIGWGDWIIQPPGYDAYFCRGTCSSVASVTQSSSHHHTFLQKLLRSGDASKPLELVPCCTAKQYSSLQLVFMDSNNTATQRTFPNMVVESCGCR